jgi:hypothetical protein
MLFVLLSHFAFNYFSKDDAALSLMTLVGMIASPTFVIINGMLLGVFYRTRTRDFERFRTIVTDRGLFLLTVGHFLVLLSHATYAVRFVSITDAVGVCMLISPWLVTTLTPRARLLLSLAAYALTLIVVLYWNPTQHYPLVLKETFFGRIGPGVYVYAFPILPWFALDLAATVLGERLGACSAQGNPRAMHRLLHQTAVMSAGIAVVLNLTYHAVRQHGYATALATHEVGSPFAKTPPSLVYFLFYGSLGLVLISVCLRLASNDRMAGVYRGLVTIGQTSFAVFVIQFFVYFTGAPRDAAAPSVGVGLAGLFRPVDRGDPGAGARVAPGGLQQIPDRRVPAALAGAWWAGGPRAGARGRAAGVVQSLTTSGGIMPKPLPDCPQCESPQLQVSRADARGAKWAQCAACGTVILLRADNTVAHVSAPTSASRSAS